MIHKQTCPQCKGNRYVPIPTTPSGRKNQKCPSCGGQGYKVTRTP